jgi:hypothetical protein
MSPAGCPSAELGEPTDDDGPTSVRQIVWTTLRYLENQQSRMDYARYRRAGQPITSSHMESAVKELNHRIKGREKFWSVSGGESVLPLKADELSTSAPLESIWTGRPKTRTGLLTLHTSVPKGRGLLAFAPPGQQNCATSKLGLPAAAVSHDGGWKPQPRYLHHRVCSPTFQL